MDDYSKITLIPKVPKKIIEAVNRNELVVFNGSGVSQIIGCKSWKQLAASLIERCYSTPNKNKTGNCINFKEKESLEVETNYKKVITICKHILCEINDLEHVFYEVFNKALEADSEKAKHLDIYSEIHRLRGINITTNADVHFDGKFADPNSIIIELSGFANVSLDRNKLFKIHGCRNYRNSLVFTVPEYIQRYNDANMIGFLKKVFSGEYTVLFLGYGLSEFELLDFLITKNQEKESKELRHFTLLPFFSGEENLLSFEQSYYNPMGIKVIGYEKNEKGFNQLYEVLKDWNKDINNISNYTYDTLIELEKIATEGVNAAKVRDVTEKIKNSPAEYNRFFEVLKTADDQLLWLEPLKKAGCFDPRNNPKPIEEINQKGYFTVPKWHAMGHLESIAEKNYSNPSESITESLIEIINNIIAYTDENDERVENYHTDYFIIKIIFLLPTEKISDAYFDFIQTALNSNWNNLMVSLAIHKVALPTLIKQKEKKLLQKLLNVILGFKQKKNDFVPLLDVFWLRNALKDYKKGIFDIAEKAVYDISIEKMKKMLICGDSYFFNSVTIGELDDKFRVGFPGEYQRLLISLVRDYLKTASNETLAVEIKYLLEQNHAIFKKIALFTIDQHFERFNGMFWEWFASNPSPIGLDGDLFYLIKNYSIHFDQAQIETIIAWIEDYGNSYLDNQHIEDTANRIQKFYESYEEAYKINKEDAKLFAARIKKQWISALLLTKNAQVQKLYKEWNAINPEPVSHPKNGFGTDYTYKNEDQNVFKLSSKTSVEIVSILKENKYKIDRYSTFNSGLPQELKENVVANPDKYIDDIFSFLEVEPVYQNAILWGLNESFKQKKALNWSAIYHYMHELINSNQFWEVDYQNQDYDYRSLIISQICDLIIESSKTDDHPFSVVLLSLAEQILLTMLDKNKLWPERSAGSIGYGAKGKIYKALIAYSFKNLRLKNIEGVSRWTLPVKEVFSSALNKDDESSFEYYVIVGGDIVNLYNLDKPWVTENINQIFCIANDDYWHTAFKNFLYSSPIIRPIYELLKKHKHYQKALDFNFDDEQAIRSLVNHISISYLEGVGDLNDPDSLINKLINQGDELKILSLIDFFGSQRHNVSDKIITRIKPLWESVYARINKDFSTNASLKALTVSWLPLVEVIDDDIFEWLKMAFESLNNSCPFDYIEDLLKHADSTPDKVGDLYLCMLKNDFYPILYKEKIISLLRKLLVSSAKE